MLRVGIWGCGGISAQHRRAYQKLEEAGVPVKLVALCDINPENFNREIKINTSSITDEPLIRVDNCYTDIDEMLEKENLDLVDICLPTFLHKDAVIKALAKDINVLVEKPMASTEEECEEMIAAAHKSKGQLMVGHLVRFYESTAYLKNIVDSGKYGKLVAGDFTRLSALPAWRIKKGKEYTNRADGVIFDMHLHDIDLVQYIFGIPKQISAVSSGKISYCDSVITTFVYDDAFVTVRGDWGYPQSFPFKALWRVKLDEATIYCDQTGKVTLYEDEGSTTLDQIHVNGGIYEEIEYFVNLLLNGGKNEINPPESTLETIKLIDAVGKSAENGGMTIVIE